jgi:hypothetical protein
VARVAREGLEDQAVPAARAVPVVREGLEGLEGLEDQAVRVVPGDPEEDRVDPAGTNDPAVSAGGLLRRRLRGNHHKR